MNIQYNTNGIYAGFDTNFNNFIKPSITYAFGGDWSCDEEGDDDNMNKVLDLYDSRKREEINNKYDDIVNKEFNNLEVVKSFNEIRKEYVDRMESLIKDNENNINHNGLNEYTINHNVLDNIRSEYYRAREEEIRNHEKLVSEIEALLSLSSDKDYQIEVLENYGIIKKGKMTI